MRFRLKPVLFTLLCIFAHSAAAEEARVQSKVGTDEQGEPVYIEADQLTGTQKDKFEASGNAVLLKADQSIKADRLLYDQETSDAEGVGSVVVEQKGSTMSGPYVKLNMDTHVGYMDQPKFYLTDTD